MTATITLDIVNLRPSQWRPVARPPNAWQIATTLVAIAGSAILYGLLG